MLALLTLALAAADLGTLKGIVTDEKTGEALIEATVKVVSPGSGQALTDVDGLYALKLAPGIYELRVFYDVYQPRRITQVEIKGGETKTLNVKLGAGAIAVEEVVVEAKADKRSAAALLVERKKSAVVQDAIGAQDIAKSPDVNASEAVKRVVSATVVDNKYLLVRGIGGRYSQTLLNGAELPSPEPDESAVPLDIFPTSLLANLTVIKTYQADIPGTFAGGAGLVETNSYPGKLDVRLSLRGEFNSEATGRPMNASPGSATDWLAFDSGRRQLPALVPRDRPFAKSVPNRADISRSFPNTWGFRSRAGLPAGALNAQLGNTFALSGASKLGVMLSISYNHRDQVRVIETNTTRTSDGQVQVRDAGTNNVGLETATLGALANIAYAINANHEINLFALYTRNMENSASLFSGSSETNSADIETSRAYFAARELTFLQLRGFHRLLALRKTEFEWQGNFSFNRREEPDVRDLQLIDAGSGFGFRDAPNSGERYYSGLVQPAGGGFANITVPVIDALKVKFGGRFSYQSRDFSARRFRFETTPQSTILDLQRPREQLFDGDTVGRAFLASEYTFTADAYRASLAVGAAYVLADLDLKKIRLIGGIRYEGSRQTLKTGTPLATLRDPETTVDRSDSAPLPAFNIVVPLREGMNLRAAYGYTLARPRFRELAPFIFLDFARRRNVSGSPALTLTSVHNIDARWEWFPADTAVFAASAFYKNFVKPIETTVYDPTDGSVTFANTQGANLVGGELEARTTFGKIHPTLKQVTLSANFSFIWSQVVLGDAARASTSKQRPLQGQSPYVANVTLGWASASGGTEVQVLYNVFGPRLTEVGFETLPDVYEQPWHRLDVSASQAIARGFRVKVSGTNLAYQPIWFKQGPIVVQRYQPGVNLLLALEWVL